MAEPESGGTPPRRTPGSKQMIAFKIGARARKFAAEGCPIEGYELLYTAVAEAAGMDSEMHALLKAELEKFEKRIGQLDDAEG